MGSFNLIVCNRLHWLFAAAMIDPIRRQYEYLYDLPFPGLGSSASDLNLYDSLLAGVAQSYISGRPVGLEDVPIADEGTIEAVLELRQKHSLTDEEQSVITPL